MSSLVWLHEDALRADHPVIQQAGRDSRIIFVWDAEYFQRVGAGFKRLVFIYETLCELPLSIYQGEVVATVSELMHSSSADTLYVPDTPNPLLQEYTRLLEEKFHVLRIADNDFVSLPDSAHQGRFHRYWKQARKNLIG